VNLLGSTWPIRWRRPHPNHARRANFPSRSARGRRARRTPCIACLWCPRTVTLPMDSERAPTVETDPHSSRLATCQKRTRRGDWREESVRQLSEAPLSLGLSALRRGVATGESCRTPREKKSRRGARAGRPRLPPTRAPRAHSLRPRPSTRRYVRACPRSIARPPLVIALAQVAIVLGVGKMARPQRRIRRRSPFTARSRRSAPHAGGTHWHCTVEAAAGQAGEWRVRRRSLPGPPNGEAPHRVCRAER